MLCMERPICGECHAREHAAMSLRKRLRIAIIGLVLAIGLGASVLGVHNLLDDRFSAYEERSELIAGQVYAYIQGRFAVDETRTAEVSPSLLQRDQVLARVLRRTVDPLITALALVDANGSVIASAGDWSGAVEPWPTVFWRKTLRVWRPGSDALMVHHLPGGSSLMLRTRLSTQAVRKVLKPQLTQLTVISLGALALSCLLAVLVSNLVGRSIERLAKDVERLSAGETSESEPFFESVELADLQRKLRALADQYHGARTDAALLRLDIDKMLQRLEETVLVFDEHGRLEMAGKPAERLLMKPRDELIRRPVDEVLPSWTELGAVVREACTLKKDVLDQAVTFARPNMRPLRLLVSVEIMKDVKGEPRGFLVTLRDAEMRRALEYEMDISARLAAINRLTSGVAHEMKNPLNAIALHLEILKSKVSNGVVPEVETITRETARLDQVVKSFLEFSRPIELRLGEVDLRSLVRDAVATTGAVNSANHVTVQVDDQGQRAPVLVDSELCLRAIANVLRNALEAMEKPGQVSVRIEQVFDDYVVSVKDEGVGIAPENHDKIYNLYFTTKPGAAGVGLALTYLVVQLHNARIDFDSEPGRGTEFRLRFPAVKAATA